MVKVSCLTAFLLSASVSVTYSEGAVELTLENFDSQLNGKNAFVKFLAPW